jgi:hypothetical protein
MFVRCVPYTCRALLALLLTLLLPARACAHGAFDNSVRIILRDESLEVMVTMGPQAAAMFLKNGPVEALQPRTGSSYPLPKETAARLCELKDNGKPLEATRKESFSDGLEVAFVAVYPRPRTGPLEFRARYYDGIPELKQGSVVLTDENGNQVGAALLSKETASAELPIPAITLAPSPATETGLARSPALLTTNNLAAASTPAAGAATTAPLEVKRPAFGEFLQLGIKHILTGYDHLLFLCGLLVVCRKIGPMLAIITCFTLAHSVTLGLAALNLVQISSRIVEPLIAATIVFVGVENFRGRVDMKTRCALALGFGLIHGFGFANALRETGLGGSGIALAKPLFAFNLGVECGQFAVVAVFLPVLFLLRRVNWFERFSTPAISAVVLGLGGFWLVQRLLF